MLTIDQLQGINRSREEQMAEIGHLQQAQEDARLRVLELERKLKGLEVNIFEELDKSLPRELLGISTEWTPKLYLRFVCRRCLLFNDFFGKVDSHIWINLLVHMYTIYDAWLKQQFEQTRSESTIIHRQHLGHEFSTHPHAHANKSWCLIYRSVQHRGLSKLCTSEYLMVMLLPTIKINWWCSGFIFTFSSNRES